MKSGILLGMILLCLGSINGQYYNKIIPFPFGNPTIGEISILEEHIYIPIIYPGDESILIDVDNNSDIYYSKINYFDFASQASIELGDDLYLYAKDRTKDKGLRLGMYNGVDTLEWMKEYPTDGDYNFPNASTALNDHIYLGFFMDHLDDHRDIGVIKVDSAGQSIWTMTYNDNRDYSYLDEIENSLDGGLFLSCNLDRTYAQLRKIDVLGITQWVVKTEEELAGGTTGVWIAPLSNGNIVQSYTLDKRFDPAYGNNGWNTSPIRLKWYDQEGEEIKQDILINKESQQHVTTFAQLQSGKGDYFFAYGIFQDYAMDEYYGLVIKFSNEGDTIWAKKYWHPDYATVGNFHYVLDLEELDNGDLVMAGLVSPAGAGGEVWLMRTDSKGCFGSSDCGDLVITDIEESEIYKGLELYPNPVENLLSIKIEAYSGKIHIVDVLGKLFKTLDYQGGLRQIDVGHLPSGLFFINTVDHGTGHMKFIKQ